MKQYKLFLFLLFSTLSLANKYDEKKRKTYDKSFNVKENAVLEIVNKYGNINISTWNQNTIKIHVEITVEGNHSAKVNERINGITVDFQSSNDKVSAHTNLGRKNTWNNRTKVKINYEIKMPRTNHLYLTNDYGNIRIDELLGRANIDLDYGNIDIESLKNKANNIVLDYAPNSKINYALAANIDCDYGNISIGKIGNLIWDSDYTSLNIGTVENLSYNMDYGSLSVGEVEIAKGDIDYTGQSYGVVKKELILITDYGSVSVGKLAANFNVVSIDSDYASMKIGVEDGASYTLDADLSYANVSTPTNFKIKERIKKNTKTRIKGIAGNGKGKITISSDYGSLKIKQSNK